MSNIIRFAAFATLALTIGAGSAFAYPLSSTYTLRNAQVYGRSGQTFTNTVRPSVCHEVLDNIRHAFYDSCTGAFIRVDVR